MSNNCSRPERRPHRTMRPMMRSVRTVVAVVLGIALAAPALTSTPSAAATCVLEPTLRLSTVNQGVGSYARLVQGKETLVRLFVTLPPCAAAKDAIELLGGSLTAAGGAGGTGTLVPPV